MKNPKIILLLPLFLFLAAGPLLAEIKEVPAPLFVDLNVIGLNKERAQNGNEDIQKAIDQLTDMGEKMMSVGPFSVVYSKKNSTIGSVHDYCSLSPYWWPDPDKKDGLPYIRKDGVVNPERDQYDKTQSSDFRDAVETLTMAYLYTGDDKFADRAIELIKIWFIDDKTRMNPNMTFAQFVPGKSTGRNYGIIESRVLLYTMDYAYILYDLGKIDDETFSQLQDWNKEFLNWLVTSDHGKKEHNAKNNHGSWYDMQTLGFALLVGDVNVQKDLVSGYVKRRIYGHILANGEQPEELVRTRAFSYSNFNLNAITEFYYLAVNNDLLTKKQNRTIRNGIVRGATFLYPFALEPDKWPYEQIRGFDGGRMQLAQTYLTLNKLYPGKGYFDKAVSIPQDPLNEQILILKNDLFKGEKK